MLAQGAEPGWRNLGRRLVQGLADLVYPPVCFLCALPLLETESRFCTKCRTELTGDPHQSCPRCAETAGPFSLVDDGCPSCRRWPLHFDATYRLGPHAGVLRLAIGRMKEQAGEDLAEVVGVLWAELLGARLREERADVVVPVPLHWFRRWQRGYNQALTLAKILARELTVACLSGWLWRTRNTPHQVGLSVTARRENVRGAFRAAPRKELRGKTVVLVDDVMTTGSTCSEAAKALKEAGAGRIVVAVLAKASS